MVLLIVDAQKEITTPRLYRFDTFVTNTTQLIHTARQSGVEVIYVRHDDGPGTAMTPGTAGFAIDERFLPAPDERVFDKTCNSAFRGTGLKEYLMQKGCRQVMIAGLQTDYCIDATIKCGFEHGFEMLVPAFANTTFDNAFMTGEANYRYHNEHMWKERYARCMSLEEALELLRRG
ncbi:MAG: cysteine hydrolase [Clostridiales bacterium]|nr:cysteine hydrolase [Clostridiales bacterium]